MPQDLLDPAQTAGAQEKNRNLLELRALENIIDATRESARQHWAAWKTIRERKLYLADGFKAWEDYCQKRWELTSRSINRNISDSETFDNLSGQIVPAGSVVPDSHMRSLSHFPQELQVEIYEQAKLTADKVTAQHIEKTAVRVLQEKEELARELKRESAKAAPPVAPSTKHAPQKNTEPTPKDAIALEAAKHIITNAGTVKTVLGQILRSCRKLRRLVASLDEYESVVENLLRSDAEKIEETIDNLAAADRRSMECADDASASLGKFRKELESKTKLRERFRPAIAQTEKHVEDYRTRLAEILHENES